MLYAGIPGWANQLDAWDLFGVIAYVQAFALVESAAVLLPLLLLAMVLPLEQLRERFAAFATGIVYVSAGWFVLAHSHDDLLRTWSFGQLLPWIGAYCASLLAISALVHGSARVRASIGSFVERVSVLASVYLLVGVAAVVIVVIRNL